MSWPLSLHFRVPDEEVWLGLEAGVSPILVTIWTIVVKQGWDQAKLHIWSVHVTETAPLSLSHWGLLFISYCKWRIKQIFVFGWNLCKNPSWPLDLSDAISCDLKMNCTVHPEAVLKVLDYTVNYYQLSMSNPCLCHVIWLKALRELYFTCATVLFCFLFPVTWKVSQHKSNMWIYENHVCLSCDIVTAEKHYHM